MSDPDMGDWSYSYDALGNLKTQTDARGCTLTLTYELLNRLDAKSSSGTCGQQINVNYDYDSTLGGNKGIGRRTSMSDGSGSTQWKYDTRGRPTRETKTITGHSAFVTIFAYNSADLPTSMTYPDGEVVTYEYNARMMLDTVIGDSTYVSDTQYDSAGRMTSRALGNGLTQTYGYYDWNEKVNNIGQGGRLETLATGSLQNLSYVYDKVGNVKQITNSLAGETSVYGYDELNRLTSWTLNGVTENYGYNGAGNLSTKGNLAMQYNDTSHPHAVTDANSNSYGYDSNGNQTTRHIGSDTFDLSYDAENRLVEVKKNSLMLAQFTFDGDGRKVKSAVNGETTYLAGGHYETKGSEITKFYFAGASRIAMRKYTIPQSMSVEYFLGDHLGSTSVTTDTTGNKVSEMRYSPWGEVRYHWVDSALSTTPAYTLPKFTFTGQRTFMDDPSTMEVEGFGLMDYNARMYDPALGRFVSADSIVPPGVQGLDRYAYVNNSPVRYIDPTGHMCSDPEDPTPECEGSSHVKTRVGDRMISGNGFFNGAEWSMQEEFDKRVATRGHLRAIQWLAGMYGITLPTGVTWAYTDAIDFDRGLSPTFSSCYGPICVDDNKVYITAKAFESGNYSVVLNTMIHEARHAEVEAAIEKKLGRDITQEERIEMENAFERDADAAVYQSGIQFSLLAQGIRRDHFVQFMGMCDPKTSPHYYVGTCSGGSSPMDEILAYFIPLFPVPDTDFTLPPY